MKLADAQLTLTPSDVTGFLACEHRTTLEVEVARGTRVQPATENDQRDLIFRKGEEHGRGYLSKWFYRFLSRLAVGGTRRPGPSR